jgi:hypothetical protein
MTMMQTERPLQDLVAEAKRANFEMLTAAIRESLILAEPAAQEAAQTAAAEIPDETLRADIEAMRSAASKFLDQGREESAMMTLFLAELLDNHES